MYFLTVKMNSIYNYHLKSMHRVNFSNFRLSWFNPSWELGITQLFIQSYPGGMEERMR